MRRPARSRRWRTWLLTAIAATLTITGGATVWALDRFVIPHVEVADVASYEADHSQDDSAISTTEDTSGAISDTSYTDADTSISITTVSTGGGADTLTFYVAEVTITDATVLRSAFANNQFGENIVARTSEIAAEQGAVWAINGDYYGFRDTGIVIRNGVIYRDSPARTGLAFYRDGSVQLYEESSTTADQLLADGVWNTLSFGPALVRDGQVIDGIDQLEIDTNVGNHSIQGEQPRTAVGVIDANHLVFVVVDGRNSGYSRGATLPELAQILLDLGATTAYNLDGGGSATMYFDGEVINQPSNRGERATSDILYIKGP